MATKDRPSINQIAQSRERYGKRIAPCLIRPQRAPFDARVEAKSTPAKIDVKQSKAFQAFLVSSRERSEVYRRLAES